LPNNTQHFNALACKISQNPSPKC